MKIDVISTGILATILLSLQLLTTRVASKALQPFVKVMLRFCMPPFIYRFMMQ